MFKCGLKVNCCSLSQDGLLLLDARKYPVLHAGHPVCWLYDDGDGSLHLFLHRLLFHHHECSSVCLLHWNRLL